MQAKWLHLVAQILDQRLQIAGMGFKIRREFAGLQTDVAVEPGPAA